MRVRNDAFNIRRFTRCLFVLGMVLIFATAARTAFAANLTLAWDANSEPDLTGYRVYCGESSGPPYTISHYITSSNPNYRPPTTYEFSGLKEGTTYYFSAKAISQTDEQTVESAYSEEISYTVPAAPVDPSASDDDHDGYSENQGDCNDNNAAVNPGATDLCGDGIDQNCNGADLACPDNNSLIREALYGDIDGNFTIGDDSAAASGQYVYVPNGFGNLMDGPDENQKITFTFNLAQSGTYRIKGTVYAANGNDDSFWVMVNGSPAGGYLWDVLQNTSYQQDYVNDRNGADPVEVSLNSGVNTVAVYLREDGTRLERLELEPVAPVAQEIDYDGDGYTESEGDCNDNDETIHAGAEDFCGDGIDQDCDGIDLNCAGNDGLVREAEDGTLSGSFVIGSDSAASGGQYVHLPGGYSFKLTPEDSQKIEFSFNVSTAGYYRIKTWVYAVDGAHDSFFVRVNDNPTAGYAWHVLNNTTYAQDYVRDGVVGTDPVEVWLNENSTARVKVYQREAGTRLDKIELEPVNGTPPVNDKDGDGFTVAQGDCNDSDPTVHVGAEDICGDGIDQDCSGSDAVCAEDIDNDGDGYTENQGDCNDANSAIRPGMQEVCGDGIDQDCNGIDLTCPEDIDNDNDGYTENQGDCNDTDAAINPGAADICGDGIDQDCIGGDPICDNVGDEPEPTEPVSALPMEFGDVEVDDQWTTVVMKRSFDDPVVVLAASSYNDQDPVVIRVRNVTGNSFEVRIQEWNYLDGEHALEKTGYIVFESGSYELPGGTRVEAGRFTASAVSGFDTVQFKQSFSTVPVVIAATTTSNESDAVAMRLRNITTGKFDYRIQEQEINNQQHASEQAGYVAWEPSAGSLEDLVFEIGRTSNSVTHAFQALNFYESFSSLPVFLAAMQTTDGGDTATVRCQNKQADGIEIKVEEEQSRDTETNHTTEVIGYMVFMANHPVQDDDTQPAGSLVREAEDGILSGRFEIGSDSAASGGQYVHVPGWSWRRSTPDEDQKVEFTFDVSATGYYRIKGWIYAPDGSRDSFFIKVNANPPAGYEWHVLRNTTYAQDYVRDGVGGNPVEIWLEKESTATVSVYQREAQTRLDKIELELVK